MSHSVTGCHFIVSLDIYYKDILFVFGYPKKKVGKIMKEFVGPDLKQLRRDFLGEPVNYKGITFVANNGAVLIYMPTMPTTPENYGTLFHEIFHAVEGVMSNIGNHHPKGRYAESWAHMIGYITAQVFHNLNQYHS